MAKLAVVIISDDEKMDLGITFAYRSHVNRRFEDIKVLFFGPSQRRLAKLEGETAQMLKELIAAKVVDSACVRLAERYNLVPHLRAMGIELHPFGERLAKYLAEGYQTITF